MENDHSNEQTDSGIKVESPVALGTVITGDVSPTCFLCQVYAQPNDETCSDDTNVAESEEFPCDVSNQSQLMT